MLPTRLRIRNDMMYPRTGSYGLNACILNVIDESAPDGGDAG